jgi:hypothetical protein
MDDYLRAPNPFIFTISGFTNPSTTSPLYYIVETVHFESATDYTIDKSTTEFPVTATTGTITISSITPNFTQIYSSDGWYKFIFTPQHEIATTYQFRITFPATFGII